MKVKVFTDGFEGHVRRSLDRARRRERGERLEPEKIITFADPVMMVEVPDGAEDAPVPNGAQKAPEHLCPGRGTGPQPRRSDPRCEQAQESSA